MGRNKASAAPLSTQKQTTEDMTTQTDESSLSESSYGRAFDTEKIMAAIATCQTTLTTKIDHLQMDVNKLRHDMDKIRERTVEAERRIGEVEDTSNANHESIRTLQQQVKILQARAEDAENRSRRNNVRILGLPERVEGSTPEQFVEQLMKEVLAPIVFSPSFVVERAHRVPTRPLPPGAPPRPFILKLLNYRDRDLILSAARRKGDIAYENSKLSFYPDFTSEVQKKRRQFTHVRSRLRTAGIKYAMLYPTRLRVQHRDRTLFFTTPEEASEWLDRRSPDHQ